MKLQKVVVVYKNSDSEEHEKTIKEVKKLLNDFGIENKFILREEIDEKDFIGADLIFTLGGDGTLLRASHFVDNEIIFGINSDIKSSEGILCSANRHDLKEKLEKIINNKFSIRELVRARILFEDGKGYNSLNEIYIGSLKSYQISRYKIKINGIEEEQKSSGIIISTGTGSSAWYGSLKKEHFNWEAKELRILVREPYIGNLLKFKLTERKINANQKICIESRMERGIVAIDSIIEIPFEAGKSAEIGISPKPLKIISFK